MITLISDKVKRIYVPTSMTNTAIMDLDITVITTITDVTVLTSIATILSNKANIHPC